MTPEKRTSRSRRGREPSGGSGRTPGQRAGLTSAEILASALRLAEEHGVERLTMRSLAADLGVAPNAIYTYFADKTALVDSLLDMILAEVDPSRRAGERWQESLANLMRASRELVLAHPRLAPHFLERSGGPNAMKLGEAMLEILGRGGIRGKRAVGALRALLAYTLGFAALEVPRSPEPEKVRRRARAISLVGTLPPEEFPMIRELADELAGPPTTSDFEAGLTALIRGIEAG